MLLLRPSSCDTTKIGMKVPITVPSFGAWLNTKLAARMWPAPGMFFGTMVGSPGMCLARWRATTRALESSPPPTPVEMMRSMLLPL